MLRLLLGRGCVGVCWWRIVSPLVLLLRIGPCVAEKVRGAGGLRGEPHSQVALLEARLQEMTFTGLIQSKEIQVLYCCSHRGRGV